MGCSRNWKYFRGNSRTIFIAGRLAGHASSYKIVVEVRLLLLSEATWWYAEEALDECLIELVCHSNSGIEVRMMTWGLWWLMNEKGVELRSEGERWGMVGVDLCLSGAVPRIPLQTFLQFCISKGCCLILCARSFLPGACENSLLMVCLPAILHCCPFVCCRLPYVQGMCKRMPISERAMPSGRPHIFDAA